MSDRTIRAKFRCLSTRRTWDNRAEAELRPVYGRQHHNFPENEAFWKYTPAGEAHLVFELPDAPFEAGAYYYIDMTSAPDSDSRWTLGSVNRTGNGAGEIVFNLFTKYGVAPEASWGSLKMTLSGESARVEDFGEPGVKWFVRFTRADATDED